MTLATPSFSVLSPITNSSVFLPIEVDQNTARVKGIVAMQYFHAEVDMSAPQRPTDLPGKPIEQLIVKWEADPRKAEALQRARRRLGKEIEKNAALSLTQLRLSKGLSQSKLAEIMGCKQPYVARIEMGEDDIKISTLEKLATALNVSPEIITKAIISVRSARSAK